MIAFETWLPIPGQAGYEVSDLGRVRSSIQPGGAGGRGLRSTPHVLRAGINRFGYRKVYLPGKPGTLVHSLVLTAFSGPRPPGMVCRHLDGDSLNNLASNLAWGTYRQNMLDRRDHGTDPNVNKTHCPRGHVYSGTNLRVNARGHRWCRTCETGRMRNRRRLS